MNHTTLIQAAEVDALRRGGAPLAIFDCSFDLANPAAGRAAYEAGHVPGAQYLHLDEDLSAPKTGRNGRHPLPTREAFAERLAARGVDAGRQVVVYDGNGGMYAARAWWMLRWAGHAAVALLDGGLAAWRAAGLPVETGNAPPPAKRGSFALQPSLVKTVDREALLADLPRPTRLVLDARAPDRFRGENETLDPVGGHIPGARNRLFRNNLEADGRFKAPAQLRAEFDAVTGGRAAAELVSSCGSGVTACHNLLALEVAGLGGAALYPGSWSEWSAWPGAPVATGG
ncbi:MAG: sulfurtransferase [Proteobacteria bacterium]|nr:sulfurtransferase [Pseudomonadota bacterium]